MKGRQDHRKISFANCFLFSFVLIFLWATILPSLAGDFRGGDVKEKNIRMSADTKEVKEENVTEKDGLSEHEGEHLLSVARKTIERRLFDIENDEQEKSDLSPMFSEKRGTFVTLTKNNNLRGCIGHIIPRETLLEGVKVNAINAAFKDPRFPPLSREEWDRIKIEVSILTEPKPLEYSNADDLLNKLRPGIDGVIIKKGFYQATFLPQVWEQLPDKKEFLIHLCMKAGLDSNAWKSEKLEVLTYQAQAFEEH
ncbi:AmmeMemoRadiSam system protein A [Thermodesulfobacteriota bacterium]